MYATKLNQNGHPSAWTVPEGYKPAEGEVLYDGDLVVGSAGMLDMEFDSKLGLRAKNDAEKLEAHKEKAVEKVQEKAAQEAVKAYTPPTSQVEVAMDEQTQLYLTMLFVVGSIKKPTVKVCDIHGVIHTLAWKDFEPLFTELVGNMETIFVKKWELKKQIQDAANTSAVDAVVWA